MEKKILLFGASGLLGSAIKGELILQSYDPVCPTSMDIDITDSEALADIIEKTAPAGLINAAALINVNELEKDPRAGEKVNARPAGAIAKILQEKDLRIPYIFISTSYVFGNSSVPRKEDDQPSPLNAYGASKALGERLIVEYGQDVPYFILRTGWLYGPTRLTFVDEVVRTLREGKTYDASVDQFGNPTSASDFANALVTHCLVEKRARGIYHVINATPETGVSRFDIACEIAAIVTKPQSLIRGSRSETIFAAKRPSAVLLNTKLPPLRDWREALRAYLTIRTA